MLKLCDDNLDVWRKRKIRTERKEIGLMLKMRNDENDA